MKKWHVHLILIFLSLTIFSFSQETPHLLLYFDINETLIASDKAGTKSIEDVINGLLAKKVRFCWSQEVKHPISYEAYIKTYILPGSDDDQALKKQRRVYFDHFLELLEHTNSPLYHPVLEEYTRGLAILNQSPSYVFASFFHLIDELNHRGISYTLVLRSFGAEIWNVQEEISTVSGVVFQKKGRFDQGVLVYEDGERISSSKEIYRAILQTGHMAIQDDWGYWASSDFRSRFGKIFFLNPHDPQTLAIFFDDNVKLDNEAKNIVSALDVITGEPISIRSLIESKQLVRVDTLEAITNPNYFIERVDEALKDYASLLLPIAQ